jgi:galactokinase
MDRHQPPSFSDIFGAEPTVRASAPGRVNLIGEHTDYNGGFVLPAAIPQRTSVELKPIPGPAVEIWSRDIGPRGERKGYTLGMEKPRQGWLDYIQGITSLLGASGHRLTGFQMRVESSVPVGSGLSSSAALEVSVLRALREAFDLELDDLALALLAQRAENEFVGAPVGIMDQMACTFADERHLLFLDARTLEHQRVLLPPAAELLVINSGVLHSHAGGEYRTRRAECEKAAAMLGVAQLRDVSPDRLDTVARLPDPLDRRARHVVTENARVLQTVTALRDGNLAAAGALLTASHQSMRDDFEVSVPEIDSLVEIAERSKAVLGARLTGGGFGGSIVALVVAGERTAAAELVKREYDSATGQTATILVPEARRAAD